MKKVTALAAPVLTRFNPFHPHQYHQKVMVNVRRGESSESQDWFVSCPKSGLTDELINAFLVSDIGVNEDLDSDGLGDGEYWLSDWQGCVSATLINPNEVYSNDDPTLLNYRLYCLSMFGCSFYLNDDTEIRAQDLAIAIIDLLDVVVGKFFAMNPELLDGDSENELHQKMNDRYKCARAAAFNRIYYKDLVDATDDQVVVVDTADLLVIQFFETKLKAN